LAAPTTISSSAPTTAGPARPAPHTRSTAVNQKSPSAHGSGKVLGWFRNLFSTTKETSSKPARTTTAPTHRLVEAPVPGSHAITKRPNELRVSISFSNSLSITVYIGGFYQFSLFYLYFKIFYPNSKYFGQWIDAINRV